ncbi:Leucine-rich repeat-containing protein [Phytophthora cinnamomi]|uniref:Leucine-rich repeat-containing protein n=1 Tax=Phytophthora cinnamomi TaxID=4785 RepID=UPI003559C477|nr:Leucine-rich repeat-containing protein [Phytophthora cinnamomi]
MGTKQQQPARPSHGGGAAKPSPLAARVRRGEAAGFPRAELWSWTDDGAKDELIESMLRECVPPMPSTPALNGNLPLPVGATGRSLLPSQRHRMVSAGQHPHPQSPSTGQHSHPQSPSTGQPSSRKARNLQSPPTSLPPPQLQPMSSKNLMAAAPHSTGQEAWKAFKVAHRTNKILAKTRKVINMLIRQNSSIKNVNDGESGSSAHGDDAGVADRDRDVDEGDKEKECEEMRAAAAAAAKLLEAKAKFQQRIRGLLETVQEQHYV